MMKLVTALFIFSGIICPLHGQNFQLNSEKLSSNITFYEAARVNYLSEIGMLEYFPYHMEDQIFMVDLLSSTVRTLGRKGDNPEEFGVERSLFSDGVYVYLFDSTKKKLLKYRLDADQFKLDDIIQIRNPVGREGKRHQSIKVLGKSGDDWIVQYLVFPNPATMSRRDRLALSLSVGVSNSDFSQYTELYYKEGKGYPQMAMSADSYLCRAKGKYFVVILNAGNFDPESGTMNVAVIDVQQRSVKNIPVRIPEKFTEFQVLDNDIDMRERLKLSKFKFVPWGARFQGLDENFYFCYYHYYPDETVGILFTMLDLSTGKVKQFEQKKSSMTPIMADSRQIAYVKCNEEKDTCDLIVVDKTVLMN